MVETLVVVVGLNVLATAFLIVRSFATGYGTKKGSNQADREDIAVLTRLVEDVKHQNAEMLEAVKSRNQLRMAAIDKRLQAHQDAYRLWLNMMGSIFDVELVRKRADEGWAWWQENCLYLEPAAREAFRIAISTAPNHELIVNASRATRNVDAVQKSWAGIFGAGDVIVKAVALPGLTAGEAEEIKRSVEQHQSEWKSPR